MSTKVTKRLTKLYERIAGGSEIDNHVSYDELPRAEQNALIRLFGGGTARNVDEHVLYVLEQRGLIHGERLTALGEEVCREALPGVVERIGDLAIGSRQS